MATGFNVEDDKCEGLGCQADSGVTYYVTEKKCLCAMCASKVGCINKSRKGDIGLSCEVHDKPVKLHCQDHELAVCQICAIKDHQKPCRLENVPVVLEQKRAQLLKLRPTLHDKQKYWKSYKSEVKECIEKCEAHYKSIEKKINDEHDDDIERMSKEEQDAAKLINEEADEEIRKINEKRKSRLEQCHAVMEERRQPVESRRRELLDGITRRANNTRTKMMDIQGNATDGMQATDKAAERMEILLVDDKELLTGAHELITSLDDSLGKTTDDSVQDVTKRALSERYYQGNLMPLDDSLGKSTNDIAEALIKRSRALSGRYPLDDYLGKSTIHSCKVVLPSRKLHVYKSLVRAFGLND